MNTDDLVNIMFKNNRIKYFFALWLGFFSIFFLHAQQQSVPKFSTQPEMFVEDVHRLFATVNLNEKDFQFDGKAFMAQFRTEWESGIYTSQQQEDMYKILNKMVEKRFSVRPYMTYFLCIQKIKERANVVQDWKIWHQSLNWIIENQKAVLLTDYLSFSLNILTNNNFSVFKGITWHTKNSEYRFQFDTIPYVDFGKTDIAISYNKDTVVLYETTCKYSPLLYRLTGVGGKIFWDRGQLPHETVWAELPEYLLETMTHELHFEEVKFFNRDFFAGSIVGTLDEKAYNNKPNAGYPKFKSRDIDLKIKRLYNNFSYEGGFGMNGLTTYGFGDKRNLAALSIASSSGNNVFIKSLEFVFSPEYISSDKVTFTIMCDEDSLFHPEMSMTFDNKSKELVLMKNNGTLGEASISDSYHRVDIQCDALYWNLNTGEIDFKPSIGLKKTARAKFISQSYFRDGDFRKLRGLDRENPLVILVQMARTNNNRFLSFAQISDVMKITEKQVELLMSELAIKDFLLFDFVYEGVILRDKAFLYVEAYRRAVDYDNLIFLSEETSKNARLRLDSMDMEIYNIHEIWLSDSQQVGVMTYVNEIVLQRNRDFSFRGFVGAGSFDFFTDSTVYSHFSYKDFTLNLPLISSLEFWVDDPEAVNASGQFNQIPVTSFIEDISGTLYIDDPNNKSGIKHFDQYSYFVAGTSEKSAVYYHQAYSPNMYPKDRFRFKVYPFVINDLQTARVENLNIPGTLYSSGIIPDFETALTLRPDHSLGFNIITPEKGFPMYGNKGSFSGVLDLSNHGLYGDGTLRYLSSISTTDDSEIWDTNSFVFFPDSTIASIKQFDIQEVKGGVEYPQLSSENVKQSWYPSQDLMTITNRETPFSIFKEKLDFSGQLFLSPTGLDGIGKINLTQMSIISSRKFTFKSTSFSSPEADVELLSLDLKKTVFNAYKYAFEIDLEKRGGEFESLDSLSYVKFPQNGFSAVDYNFTLNMDSLTFFLSAKNGEEEYTKLKQLTFLELIEKSEKNEIHGPQAKSFNIHHNGLNFTTYSAKLTVQPERHLLDFYKVPFVKVADSYIIPKEGAIHLADNPDTILLEQAELMIKNDTIHHYIYDADIKVLGQDEYRSKTGTYDYITPTDTIPIALNDIHIDRSTKKSVAKGFISDTMMFKPSPYFNYYGDITISGASPDIDFFGYVRINEDECDSMQAMWIAIDTTIDANQAMIPIPVKTFNHENKVTFTGLAHGNDGQYYTFYNRLFGQMRNSRNDDTIFTVNGFLMYDEISKEYRIGSEAVLNRPIEPDNLLRYNPETCITIGNGVVTLRPRLAQKSIDLQTFGTYTYEQNSDSLYFNLTTDLTIPMNKKIMEIISNILASNTLGDNVNINTPSMVKYLNYKFGQEYADEFREKCQTSNFAFPKMLYNTFVFTEVPFRWKQSIYTYYAKGNIGIMSSHNKMVLKKIPIYITFARHRTGNRDQLQLYFEADAYNSFYILLSERGKSYMWTNNEEVEALIKSNIKEQPQKLPKGGVIKKPEISTNEKEVEFEWIDERAVLQFINFMETLE